MDEEEINERSLTENLGKKLGPSMNYSMAPQGRGMTEGTFARRGQGESLLEQNHPSYREIG